MAEFEIKRDGVTICHGTYPDKFPDEKTRKSMKSAGCKILVDGKPYKEANQCGK